LQREECTAGTRIEILEDITKWANDSSLGSPRVFWLTGQAGSGKTMIVYTIAKRFEKDGTADQLTILGGNFLCSQQFEETRERTRIVPTIAYQLARKCRSYADALHVADKFDAVDHDISVQLKDLLVGPWQQSKTMRGPELPPYLIVIDALDEIEGDKGLAFLEDLFTAINKYDLRGFKFLVTSRTDPEVVLLLESFIPSASSWLQQMPIEEAELDIGTYLRIKLPKLSGNRDLAELGRRAGGLFIYAATAVKYLTSYRSITIRDQAEMLSDLLSNSNDPASASDATFLIDELYRQIMRDTFCKYKGKFLSQRLRILYTFLCTAERTSTSTVAALVMEGDDEATRAVVEDLHAVLYTQDDHVFWYHASFPDFIFDPTRSNFCVGEDRFEFSCNKAVHQNLLSESCFHIMETGLRFNMGNITSSFLFDSDNAVALCEEVDKNINAVLRYSCCHWAHHLPSPQSVDTKNLHNCISKFLQIKVLFWIEAMNLLKLCNQCTPMLQLACQWVLKV
jgi:Ni2+-binding GTPase involved in maturation of urease and hydrogenase